MDIAPEDARRHGRSTAGDPMTLPDEALIAGMAAGDEQAGLTFIKRHERRVFGIALAITTNRSLAEEVSQEAMLRAWRHAGAFDAMRAPATAWLSTITRNLAIDALRLQRSVPVDPDDALWLRLGDDRAAPEDHAVRADALEHVRSALRSVPAEQRRALIRSAFYGQTAAEIAEAEHIPLGTAKSRVRLGLARVRNVLRAEEDR